MAPKPTEGIPSGPCKIMMIRHTNRKKLIHWLPVMNGSGSGGLLELELLLPLGFELEDEDDEDVLDGSRLLLLLDIAVGGVGDGG
jgi:hypothetical protein